MAEGSKDSLFWSYPMEMWIGCIGCLCLGSKLPAEMYPLLLQAVGELTDSLVGCSTAEAVGPDSRWGSAMMKNSALNYYQHMIQCRLCSSAPPIYVLPVVKQGP